VKIYDIKGALLYENPNSITETSIDLSSFKAGIYFVKTTSAEGQSTHKIVKK